MTDYSELVKALRETDSSDWKRLSLDAADAIESLQAEVDALEKDNILLLELRGNKLSKRGEIVRCGECKYKPHWDEEVPENERDGFAIVFPVSNKCPCQTHDVWNSHIPDDDWFCADGEREVQE